MNEKMLDDLTPTLPTFDELAIRAWQRRLDAHSDPKEYNDILLAMLDVLTNNNFPYICTQEAYVDLWIGIRKSPDFAKDLVDASIKFKWMVLNNYGPDSWDDLLNGILAQSLGNKPGSTITDVEHTEKRVSVELIGNILSTNDWLAFILVLWIGDYASAVIDLVNKRIPGTPQGKSNAKSNAG